MNDDEFRDPFLANDLDDDLDIDDLVDDDSGWAYDDDDDEDLDYDPMDDEE